MMFLADEVMRRVSPLARSGQYVQLGRGVQDTLCVLFSQHNAPQMVPALITVCETVPQKLGQTYNCNNQLFC